MGEPKAILDATGKPARPAQAGPCPACGADPRLRRPSAGFGTPHDVCGRCGHEFEEGT